MFCLKKRTKKLLLLGREKVAIGTTTPSAVAIPSTSFMFHASGAFL